MKVTLVDPISFKRGCLNKDTAGGFGTVTRVGDTLRGRLLEYIKRRRVNFPLTSFGYLASIFIKNGHCVEYKRNGIPDCDLVIIPSSIVDYKAEIEAARLIKSQTRAKIGFIGPFASAKPDLFLPYCDFIIKGEPEEAAIKISQDRIPEGLVKSDSIEDLDSLPFPHWDIFPINEFSYFPSLKGKPFLTILSSRGCPLPCGYYCPYPFTQGSKWRFRSINNVIKEIKYLKKRYHIKTLMFRDPVFTFDKERAKIIAQNIINEGINIYWGCETHLDYLDIDLLEIMYKSGLQTLEVGIESLDGDCLGQIRRRTINIDHQEKILSYCRKIGIRVSTFYILGLPGDTEESINKIIDYAKKINTLGAQFTILTPYPGTRFYEDIKERINGNDWEDFNGYTPLFDSKNLTTEQLARMKEKAFVSYYFRSRWITKFIREISPLQ